MVYGTIFGFEYPVWSGALSNRREGPGIDRAETNTGLPRIRRRAKVEVDGRWSLGLDRIRKALELQDSEAPRPTARQSISLKMWPFSGRATAVDERTRLLPQPPPRTPLPYQQILVICAMRFTGLLHSSCANLSAPFQHRRSSLLSDFFWFRTDLVHAYFSLHQVRIPCSYRLPGARLVLMRHCFSCPAKC